MKRLTQLFVLVVLTLAITGCWNTGNGEKIGMITKLAQEGSFGCPTWEAEIVRGGFNGGNGVNGASFHFTIEDQTLVPAVKQAMESQQEVKIKYSSEMGTICRSETGNHFLTAIEAIGSLQPVANQTSPAATPTQTRSVGNTTSVLDREKIAEAIIKQNGEVLRQNQELIDLLKKSK